MDNHKLRLLFARIQSMDVEARDELRQHAMKTIQAMALKWRRDPVWQHCYRRNLLQIVDLENAGVERVLTLADDLSKKPNAEWLGPKPAAKLAKTISFAMLELLNLAIGRTPRERKRDNRAVKKGKAGRRVPLNDHDPRFAKEDERFEYIDTMEELLLGCCRDDVDRKIVRLSEQRMTRQEVADELTIPYRTVCARLGAIYTHYFDRKRARLGLPAAKVERATAVERQSERANGIELASAV